MNKLSITDAAKAAKLSRQTLYAKYINTGKISVEVINNKKFIDVSEIIRVFGNVSIVDSIDTHTQHNLTSCVDSADRLKLIAILEEQLRKSEEREAKLQEQVNILIGQQTLLLDYKDVKSNRKKFLGIF